MIYLEKGSNNAFIGSDELKNLIHTTLSKLEPRKKVLAIPPDFTRKHSFAGSITNHINTFYGDRLTAILPALGTHSPMTEKQINAMFGNIPKEKFRIHRWREDLKTLGNVPGEFIQEVSEGRLNYPWPAQVNKLLTDPSYDLILSIGQVVPHEVIGMANYNKNIFVGTGGSEGINKSHFLGAIYGMERIMGRAITPVRKVLNYASDYFAKNMPVIYILTVVGRDKNNKLGVQGLYIGDDIECFLKASDLSLEANFTMLDKPLKKVVIWLDPDEFKSTWLGNKSIYRSRMAIADGGELIVLAPGLKEFGEDPEIDRLIRKYGYLTTDEILHLTEKNMDLQQNLSAAAHLIHGSSENRFTITYCPGHLSRAEIEKVNYQYADLNKITDLYDPQSLEDGCNTVDGEEIFYISNPALGLWATKENFENH